MDVAKMRLTMPRITRKARKTYMHQLQIVMVGFGQLGSTGKFDCGDEDPPEGCEVTEKKVSVGTEVESTDFQETNHDVKYSVAARHATKLNMITDSTHQHLIPHIFLPNT